MKIKLLCLAVVLATVSTAPAQVGALRIPQQTGPQSGNRTERLVVPSASDVLGFDANKKLVRIATTGTGSVQRVAGAAVTPASVASTGAITSSSASAGIGYATGAGGTVTQGTSRTTTVVLSKTSGKITTTADSMAAQTPTTFTVTNTTVAATDVVVISKVSGDVDTFAWVNSVGSGSFTVTLFNSHASAADTTAFVFNVIVIKAVTS